jgi:DNA-binding HxlR family transcriptional regulator
MLGRTYDREVCSAARTLEVLGERWSLLILRNAAFAGVTRFTDFQQRLGVAPNVLAARLELFVAEGLMAVTTAQSGFGEYRLTAKGLDAVPILVALTEWGDRWQAPEGPPIRYEHASCGGHVRSVLSCDECQSELSADQVVARPTEVMVRMLEKRMRRTRTGTTRRRNSE